MRRDIAATAKGPIEYRLEGRGPMVVVLNGGHCSRDTRLSHERLAQEGLTVLTPSRPGYDATPSSVGRTAQAAADALTALLDTLRIPQVDLIGISAAGPTALAFAQRHPGRLRKLVLESAVTAGWDEGWRTGPLARLLFGRAEQFTWALVRLGLRQAPSLVLRAILRELTTLDVDEVIGRMSTEDLRFVRRMIETSRSGTGFVNDIEHRLDDLAGVTAPVLVMYSPHDRAVSPKHAKWVAARVATCMLFEVPSDTHLIWIGPSANNVWQKRRSFLDG